MIDNNAISRDRKMLLDEIGKIEFVLTELNLYLDTHPYDYATIDKFNYFNNIRNNMMKDYADKYGSLVLNYLENSKNKWEWSVDPMPWERGYY